MNSDNRIRWVDHSTYSTGYVGKIKLFEIRDSWYPKKFFVDCAVATLINRGTPYKTVDNAKTGAERLLARFLKGAGLEIRKEEKIDE